MKSLGYTCLLAFALAAPALGQRVITTVAGTDWLFPGHGKPAADTPLSSVSRLAIDPAGNVYLPDPLNYVVLKIDRNGITTVVAGNGIRGFSGDGGPAASASFDSPYAIALDAAGNIFVADKFNYRIRKIATNGIVSTVAGTGVAGYAGDGGPATRAAFSAITDLLFDGSGNLYVADGANNRVRRIGLDGTVTSVAGNGQSAATGDGGPAGTAAVNAPMALALDRGGNLYIAEYYHRIRRVASSGVITTVAGNGTPGYSGDGAPAAAATLNAPLGLAVDSAGALFVGDAGNGRIRVITPQGIISTVAGDGQLRFGGDGGSPLQASFFFPSGLAFDPAGNLVVADAGNQRVRRIVPGGTVSTLAGNAGFRSIPDGTPVMRAFLFEPQGLALDSAGNLYVCDTSNFAVRKIGLDGTMKRVAGIGIEGVGGDNVAATSSSLSVPRGITLAPNGDLVIADRGNDRVRRVGADGIIRTIAGNGTRGYNGDGMPAVQASLVLPSAVAFDPAGNLYIAEEGGHRIRRVAPDGMISTFAGNGQYGSSGDGGPAANATVNTPTGLAVDRAGNVYIGEFWGYRVRRVTPGGIMSTIAGNGQPGPRGDGGAATQASLGNVYALAVDSAGTVYLSEAFTHRVRRITPDGIITTVAGNGNAGYFGDGGPAAAASLNVPSGLLVDGSGTLYIADTENHRIRAVLPNAPSFTLSGTQLSFGARSGATPPASQTLAVAAWLNAVPFAGTGFSANPDAASAAWLQVTPATGIMPAALQVTVNPAGLAAGNYQGTITITAPGAIPPVRTVAVTAVVQAAAPPALAVDAPSLSLSLLQDAAPAARQFTVTNAGSGSLAFTADVWTASGGNWLSVSPGQGSATPSSPVAITATVNVSGLAPGTYTGRINVATSGSGQAAIPVNITVSKPKLILLLSQASLTFTAVAQGGSLLPQTVGIQNIGQGAMNWSAKATALSGGAGWLALSAAGGTVARPYLDISLLDVSVNPAGLSPGDYYGLVQVSVAGAGNSPQTVSVVLNVLAPGSNPGPEVRPATLVFTGVAGASPGSQNLLISNPASRPVGFNSNGLTYDGRNWFTYAPRSASVTPVELARLVVQPDFTVLDAGVWRGALSVLFDDGSVRTVNLLSVVAPAGGGSSSRREAAGACTPNALFPSVTSLKDNFTAAAGQGTFLEARVVDNCGNAVTSGAVIARFSNGDPLVTLLHTRDGYWSNTWQTQAAPGTPVRLEVTAVSKYQNQTLGGQTRPPLAGTVGRGAPVPVVSPRGIVNGASFVAQAPVAPGSLVSVFGARLADAEAVAVGKPLGTQLGGTQVEMDGHPLPLLYASDGQLNAQIPYDLAFDLPHQLLVRRGSVPSVPIDVTVAAAQPAIFTKDQSGKGQGVIVHGVPQALAEPGAAVAAGDTVVIYAAGLGLVDPPVPSGAAATGLARTVNPVSVTIGGVPAAVSYSGLTPGYPGLYQVNAVVPREVTPGDAVPVVLSLAGQASPAVTMAVR